MGLLASQQQKLATAIAALKTWETTAKSNGAHISQINLELDTGTANATVVIFEWDADAGEYAMRTTGPEGT